MARKQYLITPLPLISPNSQSQKPGIVLRARIEKKIPGPETEPQTKTKRGTAGVKHMRVGPRKYHKSPPNPKPYASPRSGCGVGGKMIHCGFCGGAAECTVRKTRSKIIYVASRGVFGILFGGNFVTKQSNIMLNVKVDRS